MLALSSGVNGTALDLELTQNDLISLFEISSKHDLTHLVGYALQKNKLLPETKIGKSFENSVFMAVYRYEQINYELKRVCEALERAEIHFIPLKGSVLRAYYPEAWMRTSCDIDVFVEKTDLEKACEVFETDLGFDRGSYSSHDVSFKTKSGLHIELHFDLIEDYRFPKINSVLKNIWDNTLLKEGTSFHHIMTDEMFYFYHIAHMVKHFKNGGCGVRTFLDLWILNNRISFVREKREKLLKEGGVYKFAKLSEKMSEVWFGDGEHQEETRLLSEFILFGGVYGNIVNRAAVNGAAEGNAGVFNFKKLWKPYRELKFWYPALEKYKILLPFYEVRRWFDIAFGGTMERKLKEKSLTANVEHEKAEKTKKLYDALNIDN